MSDLSDGNKIMFRRRVCRVVFYACLTSAIIALAGFITLKISINQLIQPRTGAAIKKITAASSEGKLGGNQTLAARMAEVNLDQYKAKLAAHASREKIILLALVDTSFLDMAFNFYETSILKFNINNYLFIGSDHQACEMLSAKSIHCYLYMTDTNANKATIFRSHAFNQKMSIRTFFILDALRFGFTVLHTDIDIVFLSNPLEDLYTSVHGDIACLSDKGPCNAGFVYIKPFEFAAQVYTKMRTIALETKLDDQTALNRALAATTRQNRKFISRKQMLPMNKYQCGLSYFEFGHRYFAEDVRCQQCVVVHNNWIVSKEAKRYRFREVLLWSYDENGYYSDTTTKYLMYYNAPLKGTTTSSSSDVELDALRTALYIGHVLNRVVILPRFHLADMKTPSKQGAERPLNTWIHMASFDAHFYGKYRENSFLHHEKVPRTIKQNITNPFWIKTNQSINVLREPPSNVTVLTRDDEGDVTTEVVLNWFGQETSAVLSFHSLYGVFGKDSIPKSAVAFFYKLAKAFKRSDYRQLKG